MLSLGKSKSNISIKISCETVQILQKTEDVKTDGTENSVGTDKQVSESVVVTQDCDINIPVGTENSVGTAKQVYESVVEGKQGGHINTPDGTENSVGTDKQVSESVVDKQGGHINILGDKIERKDSLIRHSVDHPMTCYEESVKASTSINPKNDDTWNYYTPFITYEGEIAVYTDPSTNIRYCWNTDQDTWIVMEKADNSEKNNSMVTTKDERVYSYENDTHIYTEKDGSKYFWDQAKAAWFPKIDDDFLAQYQMNYGFIDNTSQKEKEREELKLKLEEEIKQNITNTLKKKISEEPKWFDASENNNTKVYVTNLPHDITEEEFLDIMQKCGLVMRDPITQKMKIKLYADKETNELKGDALCTYIKIESVDLALKLLDGSDLRGNTISVQRAKFEMKGDYNPALKPKKKRRKEKEKLKKMQEKLFDWRPEKLRGERAKHERIVIVKNVFHSSDFDEDVKLILDYQEDLRNEFSKCGEVRKVILYDRHPEGVAQVTMAEPEEADTAVKLINGRWFGKRQLSAEIWDGRTKYKIAETDADINKRVDKWEKFLDGKEGVKEGTSLDCDSKAT